MYIVKYSTGSYDDYGVTDIFITDKKSIATKYVTKFNSILKKWNNYYKQFEETPYEGSCGWIKDEFSEQYFWRWHRLKETNKCWWEEIEVR